MAHASGAETQVPHIIAKTFQKWNTFSTNYRQSDVSLGLCKMLRFRKMNLAVQFRPNVGMVPYSAV